MKTTMRCDLVYMAIRRRKGEKGERRVEEISVGKDVEKLEPLHTASGSVKQCDHKGQILQDTTYRKCLNSGRNQVAQCLPGAGWEWVVIV